MPYIDDPSVTRKVPGVDFTGHVPGSSPRADVAKCDFAGVPRVARFREFGTFVPPPDPQEGFDHVWVTFRRVQATTNYDVGYRLNFNVDGTTLSAPVGAASWSHVANGGGHNSLPWSWYMTKALANGENTLTYCDYNTFSLILESNMTDPTGADLAELDGGSWYNPAPSFGAFYVSPTLSVLQGGGGAWKLVDTTDPASPVISATINTAGTNWYTPGGMFVDSNNNLHGGINKSGANGLYRASLSSVPASQTYELSAFDEVGRAACGLKGRGAVGSDTMYLSTTASGKFFRVVRIASGTPFGLGYINQPVVGQQANGVMQIFQNPTTLKYYLLVTSTTTSDASSRLLYIYDLTDPEAPTLHASLCDPNYGAGRLSAEVPYGMVQKGDKVYFWHGGSAAGLYADEGIWVIDLADMDNIAIKGYTKVAYHASFDNLGITQPVGATQFWSGIVGPYTV